MNTVLVLCPYILLPLFRPSRSSPVQYNPSSKPTQQIRHPLAPRPHRPLDPRPPPLMLPLLPPFLGFDTTDFVAGRGMQQQHQSNRLTTSPRPSVYLFDADSSRRSTGPVDPASDDFVRRLPGRAGAAAATGHECLLTTAAT
ncbi:hypothetical protein PYCCODRAFT_362390 [Trametes coccinea BRFM310]|uniref:Uncharacterized protein n=1 Tax=Trametes coccinea (strain BRFM310) TaxID=1353009 RepID=A0A1Y2J6N9_TRAC3|nr:hypothetical protein PYCCODRAFT_362390 [Trametes coccinea BRFM310]